MVKKGCTSEQVINKLREAEVLSSQGETIAVVSKQIEVTEQIYYRWCNRYGSMKGSRFSRSNRNGSGYGRTMWRV